MSLKFERELKYRHQPGRYAPELMQAAGRLVMTWAELEHQIMLSLESALSIPSVAGQAQIKPGFKQRAKLLLKLSRKIYRDEPVYSACFKSFLSEVDDLKNIRESISHGVPCMIGDEDSSLPGFVRHDLFGGYGTRVELIDVNQVNSMCDRAFQLLAEAHEWSSEFFFQKRRASVGTRYWNEQKGWHGPNDLERSSVPRRVVAQLAKEPR